MFPYCVYCVQIIQCDYLNIMLAASQTQPKRLEFMGRCISAGHTYLFVY